MIGDICGWHMWDEWNKNLQGLKQIRVFFSYLL